MQFIPYPSIRNSGKDAFVLGCLSPETQWVATHKYHGTNFIVRVGADGSIAFGRRNGFLADDERHYNFREAIKDLDFSGLAASFLARPSVSAVWVYMELYGGGFPGARKDPSAKLVQKGIWYSNVNRVRVFDIFLQTATATADAAPSGVFLGETDPITGTNDVGLWIPFHEARVACEETGIPFVSTRFQGTVADALAWAAAHAADKADVDDGMPDLEANAGEGHVVRSTAGHYLVKVKNPAWSEISKGNPVPVGGGTPSAPSVSEAVVRCSAFYTPARVASVLSKESEADVSMANLPRLAKALRVDGLKDMTPEMAKEAVESKTNRTITALCFRLVRAALMA